MNITMFNKKYWVRRLGTQTIISGYIATTQHEDFVVDMNVHPAGSDQQQATPEGERRIKRLDGHGTCNLRVANHDTGVKGDLLYYGGEWYECVNAQTWDHTVLNHTNYSFVLVPTDAAGSTDVLSPPSGDPAAFVGA